jgi:hypothetical protein
LKAGIGFSNIEVWTSNTRALVAVLEDFGSNCKTKMNRTRCAFSCTFRFISDVFNDRLLADCS